MARTRITQIFVGLLSFAVVLVSFSASALDLIEMGNEISIPKTRFGGANDAFSTMLFSQDWEYQGAAQRGVYPAGWVAQRILHAFFNEGKFKGLPDVDISRSELWIRTMNFGDPIITASLLKMAKHKIGKMKIIATGSRGFSVKKEFGREERYLGSDLNADQGWMGEEAAKLIEHAGFKVNPSKEAPYEILVTSVNPNATIEDIQHEKAVTFVLRFKKTAASGGGWFSSIGRLVDTVQDALTADSPFSRMIVEENGEQVLRFSIFLTDNFTPRKQTPTTVVHEYDYMTKPTKGQPSEKLKLQAQPAAPQDFVLNRIYEVMLPELIKADHEHAIALADALRSTGKIGNIKDPNPPRTSFTFEDGSFIQLMYTNHTQNPFDREIELLQAIREGKFKARRIYRSHFQDVNGAVLEELRKTLDYDKDLELNFLYSDDAISPRKGVAGAYFGIPVRSDLGLHPGFYADTRGDRIKVRVLRKGEAADKAQNDAYESKVLNHDKTTLYVGDEWTYIFTGSWNLSAHVENAEWQWLVKVPTQSPFAQYVINTIESTIRLHPDIVEDGMQTIVMKSITDYIGIESDSVPSETIRRIEDKLKTNSFGDVISILRDMKERGTDKDTGDRGYKSGNDLRRESAVKVDKKEFEERIHILETAFTAWRKAIRVIRKEETNGADDGILGDIFEGVGVLFKRGANFVLDKTLPAFFGRGMFSESQLVALMNGLNIERTRVVQMTRKEAGVTKTSGFSRLRFYYAMAGGASLASDDDSIANAFILYNVIRKSIGLELEDIEDFKRNLETERRGRPAREDTASGSGSGGNGSGTRNGTRRSSRTAAASASAAAPVDSGSGDACDANLKKKDSPTRRRASGAGGARPEVAAARDKAS